MNAKKDQRKLSRMRAGRLSLTFHNRACKIFNISEHGVAFSINAPREVRVGEEIDSMVLNKADPIEVSGFARHISHISAVEPDADVRAEWVCGAEFHIQGKPELAEKLKTYIKDMV